MFQVLSEMVGAVELLRVAALAKLVHGRQVFEPAIAVRLGKIGEFFAAIPAHIVRRADICLIIRRYRSVERCLKGDECGTRPGIPA
jgi:hypothetical protein